MPYSAVVEANISLPTLCESEQANRTERESDGQIEPGRENGCDSFCNLKVVVQNQLPVEGT